MKNKTNPHIGSDFNEFMEAKAREEIIEDAVFGQPDADGWYEWHGAEDYRPAGKVDVLLRDCDGDVHTWDADSIRWAHCLTAPEGDVMKWRPAQ